MIEAIFHLVKVLMLWAIVILIIVALIIGLFYSISSSEKRPINQRDKWYKIPRKDLLIFVMLRRCWQIYKKEENYYSLSNAYKETIFNEITESHIYPLSARAKVRNMLGNTKLMTKYFSENTFGATEFYRYLCDYKEFLDNVVDEIVTMLPEAMKKCPAFIKCLRNLISAGILDKDAQPNMIEGRDYTYYYVLTEVVWEYCDNNGGIEKKRNESFAKLWAEDKTERGLKNYENKISSSIHKVKTENNDKYARIRSSILKIISDSCTQ